MSERRETHHAGQDRAEPQPVITQRLTFADGSEIVVTVKAIRQDAAQDATLAG